MIEDDPDDAMLLREFLVDGAHPQFLLTHASTLGKGLKLLEEKRFNVVLSDLVLPDSQGLETFTRLHAHSPSTPVIVLSGLNDEALAIRAVQEGAQDYLVKGQVDRRLLVRSIRYAIERQRTLQYRALIMERERFDVAVSQMSDAIIVTDAGWRVLSANHAACLLLNLDEETCRGTPLDDTLQPFRLSVSTAELQASLDRVTAFDIARPHTRPPLFLDARLTRIFDERGGLQSAVLMVRDVTDERSEQRVRADFFALVSHKLRTPLAVLSSYLYLFRRLPPEVMATDAPEVIKACEAEIARLTKVVSRLLDFKAFTTHQLAVEARQTDVDAVLGPVVQEIRRRSAQKNVEVVTELAADAGKVDATGEHLTFVFDKLLENAVKFADKDPIRIRVAAERKDPWWIRVSVRDNGPGIPHEYYDRVLEGFMQIEDRTTGQLPGLGVGLSMARQVVEAYGGTMSLHSKMGEGTTVAFTLPSEAPGQQAAPKA